MQKLVNEKIIVTIKNDSAGRQVVLNLADDERIIDYQEKMIQNNSFGFLVPFKIRRRNDKISIEYDITSKIPAVQFIKSSNAGRQQAVQILKNLLNAVKESADFMLDEKSFIINGDYVFINPEDLNVYLMYVPIKLNADFDESLKIFTNKLISSFIDAGESQNTFIQKIDAYIKSDDFNLSGFKSVLEGIKKLKGFDKKVVTAVDTNGDFKISIPKADLNEKHQNTIKKLNVFTQARNTGTDGKADDRIVTLSIIGAVQVLMILSVILIFQFAGSYDLTTIFGIILIAASADTFIIKYILEKKKVSFREFLNIGRNEGLK